MARKVHHASEAKLVSEIHKSLLVVQSSLWTYSQDMKPRFQACETIRAHDVSTYLSSISATLTNSGLAGVEPIVKSKDACFLDRCKDFLEGLEDLEADRTEEQDGDATFVYEAFSLVLELACSVGSESSRETKASSKKQGPSSGVLSRTERPGESGPDA